MAIIDDLRKEQEDNRYKYVDSVIEKIICLITEKVRLKLIKKDNSPVYIEGMIYSGFGYTIGLPRDSEGWYEWRISDEDEAKYVVENLRTKILKEFRPQILDVSYNVQTKGFFKVETYYTIYVRLAISI